ncbi:MAG: DapH/DapD/GlmU-related protein [Nitrospirota bacterium]
MHYTLEDIAQHIGCSFEAVGNQGLRFSSFDPISGATDQSICWIRAKNPAAPGMIAESPAAFIVCEKLRVDPEVLGSKCLIQVECPDVAYLRLVKNLHPTRVPAEAFIHDTAIVASGARLGRNIRIGAHAIIGDCEIGNNCVIKANAIVHSSVTLGSNVLISEYCNIGGQGFGHILNEHGLLENMLHIGRVVIEDDVEIFPYTNVDRATLSETRIQTGTKIDHYCHIGHNSTIGSHSVITARVVLCGGAKVGSGCFVGVGSLIREGVSVGDKASIGLGSIVTKDIPDGQVWVGAPARPIHIFKAIQKGISDLHPSSQSGGAPTS